MVEIIKSKTESCTGCNRCVRECPMETVNITYQDQDGNIKVRIDQDKCIGCGRCITACKHDARYYADDIELFFDDLSNGVPISLIAAPSIRTNIPEYKRLFTYLKQLGVKQIYDVSLGADISIWGYIRYLEKNKGAHIITQPCPVVVSYCEMYRHDLLPKLSPVHSPMACASIYMKEYQGITDRIAALSPCIAKKAEFEATKLAEYNITFARLLSWMKDNDISLPAEETDFDHDESGLGSLFPMPGGLKENLEYFLGKKHYITKAEGFNLYDKLDQYAVTPEIFLPEVFDVLNCEDGCNIGTAVLHDRNPFEIDKTMDENRKKATEERKRDYYESVYKKYDKTFELSRFLREYKPVPASLPVITDADIEEAFTLLGKTTYDKQHVDCGTCGSDSCYKMARKIALGVNIPDNCVFKTKEDASIEHKENVSMLERFELIWGNVEGGITIVDAETREILDVNPAAVRIFNGVREDMIGRKCQDVLCPAQKCPVLDLGQNVDRSERIFVKSDGTEIPIIKSVVKINYSGRPALLESYSDISHMKSANEQKNMLEIGERMRLILTESPQINFLFDSNFRVIECNPAAVEFMGFKTKEETIAGFAERMTASIPPFQPDGRASIPLAERLITTVKEGHVRFETELIMGNENKNIVVEFKKIPYEDSFAIVGYVFDMTDIHLREQALKHAHELNELQLTKLTLVVQASKIGLWDMEIVNGDTTNPDNLASWSDEFRHMLGYEDLNDFPNSVGALQAILHPEDIDSATEAFGNHLMDKTGKTPYDTEFRLRKKSGEYVYFHATGETIRDKDGNPLRVAGALMDISESKNILLDSERQRMEADEASRSKSVFLANMSHEIRTPMNAIIGMTSIAESSDRVERKNYAIAKIKEAAVHLLGVINDILDVSKIESGKLELSPVDFNFESMLKRVVTVNNLRVIEKKQKLMIHIDKSIPGQLLGDEQRLTQVITNLLSNAIKFTPEGGDISISANLLEENNGMCTLQIGVADSGIGISPEQQSKLFQSFQQAESSTTRKYGGTGLGLVISKNIVEMMGGEIWIESELGEGATFSFTIQMQRLEDKNYSAPDLKNLRFLAVDDNLVILEYFNKIAERYGALCHTAVTAEDAIRLREKHGPYNLYFVDYQMPGMSGMELTRILKEMDSEKAYVIMMSGMEWNSIEEEARNTGVDKFLLKPIFPSNIVDSVNEYLGAGQYRDEVTKDTIDRFEGCTIMLVEDIEINREIVLTLLEDTLLTIDCAENGRIAVEKFSRNPEKYDAIFMDIQMPEMDGYEATEIIRALDLPNAKDVPIIAMTANAFREDIEKCLEVGMNSHVGKPIDFSEVLEMLRTYLKVH